MPFAHNGPIFNRCEFPLNRHKQSRKQSQIILERFWRRCREFGAISRISRNRPCSKPWASPFVQNRPIFDTCEFTFDRNKPSRKHSQFILERFWRRCRKFEAISRISRNRPCSKPWASPFVHNRPIFDTCEFTFDRNKPSRKQSQVILERFWRRCREFGAISRISRNRPCSKPWAIEVCSKSANFRHLRIYPKSTQTVAQAVTIHLERFWRRFREFGAISRI